MDTTKEYSLMCLRAKEIQGSWTPGRMNFQAKIHSEGKVKIVWLPRQDQLQAMVAYIAGSPILMLRRLVYLIREQIDDSYWQAFSSMEQLWLAFVMYEKYKKHWDGAGWAKREA